ncbi:MAG: class I SAM-dependent methyltransferase [Chloroflexota bacterium]
MEQLRGEVAIFPWRPIDEIDAESALHAFDMSRPRLNVLAARIPRGRGVDISTGLGFLPPLLERIGVEVVATECDVTVSRFLTERGWGVKPYRLGMDRPPFAPATLDFVIFSEVLEHLRFPAISVVGELAGLLKPGGTFLLSTPNVARRSHIESLLSGENFLEPFPEDIPWGEDGTLAWEHVREYSVREVVEAVEANGLAVDSVLMTGWGDAGYEPHANPYVNEVIVVRANK